MADFEKLDGQEGQKVSLERLSSLTGFPVNFIKKELVIKSEEISLEELRLSVSSYLKNVHKTFIDNTSSKS